MTKSLELAKELVNSKARIVNEVRKVIVGQDEVVENLLIIKENSFYLVLEQHQLKENLLRK